jgi:hypothetical protein
MGWGQREVFSRSSSVAIQKHHYTHEDQQSHEKNPCVHHCSSRGEKKMRMAEMA